MIARSRLVALSILGLALATSTPVLGASEDDAQDDGASAHTSTSLLGDVDLGTSGYAAPVMKVGKSVQGNNAFAGVQGAWQALPYFAVGLGAYGLAGHVKSTDDPRNRNYDVAYGGLRLEATPLRSSIGALGLGVLLGGGSIVTEHPNNDKDRKKDTSDDKAPNGHFRIVEPELEGDVNVLSWLRVGLGVGYRFASGVDFAGVTARDLSGASGVLAIKFGAF